jgi:hypothetical protein
MNYSLRLPIIAPKVEHKPPARHKDSSIPFRLTLLHSVLTLIVLQYRRASGRSMPWRISPAPLARPAATPTKFRKATLGAYDLSRGAGLSKVAGEVFRIGSAASMI